MDSAYLKATVGEALTKGCAAAATTRPHDPVEFLAKWLRQYVKNESIVAEQKAAKAAAEVAATEEKAKADAAAAVAAAAKASKEEALASLDGLVDDPYVLWAKAAEVVKAQTGAGMVYVGNLVKEEVPPAELPEDDDGTDPEEPEDAGEEPEPEAAEGEEPNPDPFGYAAKHIHYAAAAPGSEMMVGKTLKRPSLPEDAEEGTPLPPAPVTFNVPDGKVPAVDVPNVLYKMKDITFFGPIPRVGAYYAAGLNLPSGEVSALLCADTLQTAGSGKPFTLEEKDFIVSVALKVSANMGEMDAKVQKYVADAIEAHAPPPPPEEGEEAPAEEAPPAEEPPAEEGEAEEVDPIEAAEKVLAAAKEEFAACTQEVTAQQEALMPLAKLFLDCPPATARLIRATLALTGTSIDDVEKMGWPELRAVVCDAEGGVFAKVAGYDAAVSPSEETASYVRRCYLGLVKRDLWKETPLGVPLKAWIIKSKAVAAAAAEVTRLQEEKAAAEAEAAAAAAEGEGGEAPAEEAPAE